MDMLGKSVASKMKVGIVQMLVGLDKQENIARALAKIKEASERGAQLVVLPECFNSPYGTSYFKEYSEPIPQGATPLALGAAAREHGIWLIGGTIPELDPTGRLYNTCTVYSPTGQLIERYRKMHLFDIDIPGKITFKESEILTAGSSFCSFALGDGVAGGGGRKFRVGVGICYDLRFPEFSSVLTREGCNLLVFPGAFNTTTGPLHWSLLQRARALDSQAFVLTASPARNPESSYQAYGHSMIVSPWGEVMAEAGNGEENIYADLDLEEVQELRQSIPILRQKRTDLYSVVAPTGARADRYRKRAHQERDEQAEDPVHSLEQTIFNVGNKHPTLTPIEDVQQTADMVLSEYHNNPEALSLAIAACLLELPHKLEHYLLLLCKLHPSNADISKAVLAEIASHLKKSAEGGPWRHFVQAVRAFTGLVKADVLSRESYVQMIGSLLELLQSPVVEQVDFVLWTLCASLPLLGAELMTGLFPSMAADLNAAYEKRMSLKRAVPKDLLALWSCFSTSQVVLAFSASGDNPPVSLDLSLVSLCIDQSWDCHFESISLFPDTFTTGDAFERWNVTFWCRALLESVELNHRRCADIMLKGIPAELGSADKAVVEFLFGELLRDRQNGVPGLVYETLMMDCCRLSRTFPPVMAKGLCVIYEKLDELGFIAADRLASWFAYHLSNFDYKWNWAAWSAVLVAPQTSMQYIFVRFTLEKLMRLSYHDRVAPTLPEEFKALLPPQPNPNFKFAVTEGQVPDDEAEVAMRVTQLIQNRAPAEEIRASLGEVIQDELDFVQKEVLLQSLLKVGSKSLSHMLAVVEKYLALFQMLLPKNADASTKMAANSFILDQLSSFWRDSVHNFEFTVERLINYRILIPKAVLTWVFQRADEQLSDVEHSFYSVVSGTLDHGLILRTIQQASMMPSVARSKMQSQAEDKISSVLGALEKEYEDTLQLALEKLATLKEQIVATPETVSIVDSMTIQYAKEILTLYPQDSAKVCPLIISHVARKASPAMMVLLEQASS